jgi:hypothetical protein
VFQHKEILRPLVVSKLIGGLGNQMFQYAVGRAVAQRHGASLLLDVSGYEHYDLRRYELDEFAINARPANSEELTLFIAAPRTRPPTLLHRIFNRIEMLKPNAVLQEASFTYDARIETQSLPVYLDGYWQSEKYFAGLASALRSEFTLKGQLDPDNTRMAKRIAEAGGNAISLHIRRGDYVTNAHTAQYHGVCSLDYYRVAVAYMADRVEEPHFFIFSDDHDWVSANLDIGFDTTLVDVNGPDRGICDMDLMKSCRHHIVANSSFSWWGAWLNPCPEKIVIAPKQWFKQASNDTCDLLPDSWVKL